MKTVAVGGTFNVLHIGHKALLEQAFELGDLILIGLTTDDLANRNRERRVRSYQERRKHLLRHIESGNFGKKFTIVPLTHPYGLTLEKDLDFLVVSHETSRVADKINYIRSQKGKSKIKVVVVDTVMAEDGIPVSSTRVVNREITPDGKIQLVLTEETFPKSTLEDEKRETGKDPLLVHICCAPCLASPFPTLSEDFNVIGFFYNPNIQPFMEYRRRISAVREFTDENGMRVIYKDVYDPEHFMGNVVVSGMAKGERCVFCYRDRLTMAAEAAKRLGISYFTTTLLSSPYQIHELIADLGHEIAGEKGLNFHYYDVRDHYGAGVRMVHAKGIFVQNYCGCLFSERDRFCRSLIE